MISREVKILSLSFMFIILGYASVQQYTTTFFSEEGLVNLGFTSLFLVYLFFTLSIPFSTMVIGKIGSRNSMILASIFYSAFILSLITKSHLLVYLFSSLLGIAAALLWNSQTIQLIKSTHKNFYGKNAGLFVLMTTLGGTLGLNLLGLLSKIYSLQNLFLMFSIFPLIGFVLLFKLKNFKPKNVNKLAYLKTIIRSKTALKISFIFFSFYFVYGLTIGLVPINIKEVFGITYIGVLSSLFYLVPFFFSYKIGKISDKLGRKKVLFSLYVITIFGLVFLFISKGAIFLILGILLLALNQAIIRPISQALIGDLSKNDNLGLVNMLFWMAQIFGIVMSFLFSGLIQNKSIYLLSIFVILLSFVIYLIVFTNKMVNIKMKIVREVR